MSTRRLPASQRLLTVGPSTSHQLVSAPPLELSSPSPLWCPTERARTNPAFAKAIIRSYASGKLAKGKSLIEVGWKLDLVEQEIVAMRVSLPRGGDTEP